MSEEGIHMSNLNPNANPFHAPPFGGVMGYCDTSSGANMYPGDMMPPQGSYGMQGGGGGGGVGDYDVPGSYGNMPPNRHPGFMNTNMHFHNAYNGAGGGGGGRAMAPSSIGGGGGPGMFYGSQQGGGGGNVGGSNMMGNNNSRGGRPSGNNNNSYNGNNNNSGSMNPIGGGLNMGGAYGGGGNGPHPSMSGGGYGGGNGPHTGMSGGGNKGANAGMMMDRRRPVMMGGANNSNIGGGGGGGYGMGGGGGPHMQQPLPPPQQQQQSSMYMMGPPTSHQTQPSVHPGQTPPLSSAPSIVHRVMNNSTGIHSTPPLMHHNNNNTNKMMANSSHHHHHHQPPHGSTNEGMNAPPRVGGEGGGGMLPSSAMASRMNVSAHTTLNSMGGGESSTPNRHTHMGMNKPPGNRGTSSPPLGPAKTASYMNYPNNYPHHTLLSSNNTNAPASSSSATNAAAADAATATATAVSEQEPGNTTAAVQPEPPKVILVTGYKGTGKTAVAKALAKSRRYEYISLKAGAKGGEEEQEEDGDDVASRSSGGGNNQADEDGETVPVSLTQRLAPLTRLLQRHRQQRPITGMVIDDALLRNRYEAHYVHHLLHEAGLELNVLVMVTMDLSDLEKRGVDFSDKADMHAHPESFEFGQEVEEASGSAAEAIVVVDGNAAVEQVVAEAEQQVSEAEQRGLPGLRLPHVEFMPGCPLVTDPSVVEEVLMAETRALSLGEDGYDFPYVEPNFMLDYVQFVRHALLFKSYLVKPWIWGDKVSVIGYGPSVYIHLPAYRILFEMADPPEPLRVLLRVAADSAEAEGKKGGRNQSNKNKSEETSRSASRSNSCRRTSGSAAEDGSGNEMYAHATKSATESGDVNGAKDSAGREAPQEKAGERKLHFSLEGVMLNETLYILDMMQLGDEMGSQLVLHKRMSRLTELLSGLNKHDDGTQRESEMGKDNVNNKGMEDNANKDDKKAAPHSAGQNISNNNANNNNTTDNTNNNNGGAKSAEKETSCRVRLLQHYPVHDVMKCITAYKKVARGLLFTNPDGMQAGNYDSRNFIYPDEDRKTVQIRIWHGCCDDKGMWTFDAYARENDEEVQIHHTDGSVIPVHISDKQVNEFSINDGNIVECILESAAPPTQQAGQQQQAHKGKKGGAAAATARGSATPRFVFQRRCFWQATPTTLYYQSAFSSPPTWPTRLFTEACAAIKHEEVTGPE